MRKLLTIATITVAALGIGATTAEAAPDPTRLCDSYHRNLEKITKAEHELEIAAAYAGLNVADYCAANAG